jgi:hypothetical protein
VVTASDEIILNTPIVAVGITGTIPDPIPDHYVLLPWSPHKHKTTSLKKPSAAVCDWFVDLLPGDAQRIEGFIPEAELAEILEKIQPYLE